MRYLAALIGLLTAADPAVLMAVVCIVALLVAAKCVEALSKKQTKGEG